MFSLLSFAQEKNNRPSSYNYRRGVEAIQNHNTDEALDYLNKEIEKIQKMGAVSTKAVKEEILKEMGLTTEKIKLIKDDVYGKYINDVKVATGKVKGKVRMGAGHYGWMGSFTKPFSA